MKSTNSHSAEETPKTTQSKSNKKSTKSRSKSTKSELGSNNSSSAGPKSLSSASGGSGIASNNNNLVTTPTTPTTSTNSCMFETPTTTGGSGGGSGSNADANNSSRSHQKSYAGLEPRSIKIIWEQHDHDVELSTEVCARVAEDATYKLWELVNSIKTYARHSGGVTTYDLVNEVLRDADVPPSLGAMESDWDRIDYDGSYFFYSDKVIELREEYQKDVSISMPYGADIKCSWALEDKNAEVLKKYMPSLIYVALYGDAQSLETALSEAAFSPIIGSCYRPIVAKVIQILAFKQNDAVSARCWRLLRACAFNPHTRDVDCREEYFHLAEILMCQLLAPFESIKLHHTSGPKSEQQTPQQQQTIKMEIDEVKLEQQLDMKTEYMDQQQHETTATPFQTPGVQAHDEKIYKLETEDEDESMPQPSEQSGLSPYFASPVDWKCVDELCTTVGQLAAINGYFQSECLFHIIRRLERFFEGRIVCSEKEYNYISRAVRCLIALGELAFREFIPFVYKLKVDDVPETLWNDFALGAVFLHGSDDIFLYEWLEYVCGADKLLPFMVHSAHYHEALLTRRFLKRKPATFHINAKLGVRRLEWSTLAAAMCHGDDPNKALKPKPLMNEVFPDLVAPNLQLNRAGTIRFKFAGCRPVILKPKATFTDATLKHAHISSSPLTGVGPNDILIARRKLFKPLKNNKRVVALSGYCFARI